MFYAAYVAYIKYIMMPLILIRFCWRSVKVIHSMSTVKIEKIAQPCMWVPTKAKEKQHSVQPQKCIPTRSSAVAERPRDAPCRWKSCCHSRSL